MNSYAACSPTDGLRAIPLPAVLLAAGARPDPFDQHKWHTHRGIISLTGSKFFNWNRNTGGGGAIDLAMHLHDSAFRETLAWLANLNPAGCHRPIPQPGSRSPTLPAPVPNNLATVTSYLTGQRRLPMNLLRPPIAAGLIYADARANAVFILTNAHAARVGAELRGTGPIRWRGMAPGSRKDCGCFRAGPKEPCAVVLCESAIDAISCLACFPDRLCISTSGARPSPLWLNDLITLGLPIFCGFDSDPTGEAMAQAMIARYPTVQRLAPPLHDWNDTLGTRS